jgi:hypothetical protein
VGFSIEQNIEGIAPESDTEASKATRQSMNDTAMGIVRFYKWCKGKE